MNERKPLRLHSHNYSDPKSYFVTIKLGCELKFGEIIDNNVQLNEMGIIAKKYWEEIPEHFNECELDEYIIMPDHIHGIIRINSMLGVGDRYICPQKKDKDNANNRYICPQKKDRDNANNRKIFLTKENNKNQHYNHLHPYTDADPHRHVQILPKVIGNYKAAVSRKIHKTGNLHFKWQRSYNDRIIRNNECERFRAYIINNPKKWEGNDINGFELGTDISVPYI